jgi:MFS family permease
MGAVFFFTFAAYDTIQVFAQKVYKGNLGSNMTMCIYVCFTASCLGAPAAVNQLGSRLAMFVGIICYGSVVAAGLVYFKTGSDATVYACACLLGVGAGLLWIGQGRLLLDYTNDANRGLCFSLFWAMYRGAALLGGVVSFTYFSVPLER